MPDDEFEKMKNEVLKLDNEGDNIQQISEKLVIPRYLAESESILIRERNVQFR
ncbi:hypothetical protein ACFVS2_25100 [Brevibacillus sp. NPDC058079]|uniref:hypothetical protein n=1 Tax=Brevibacillus sp. NPDC058079 TaxID=3346330 RepID=UPI0036EC4898